MNNGLVCFSFRWKWVINMWERDFKNKGKKFISKYPKMLLVNKISMLDYFRNLNSNKTSLKLKDPKFRSMIKLRSNSKL